MKKRFLRILAAVLYGAILLALMTLQMHMLSGSLTRALANIGALALALPSVLVCALYLKSGPDRLLPNDAAAKEASAPKPQVSPEQLRPHLYAYLRDCSLSPRETEVAWLIFRGYTNLQIGEELYISETTVKKHASHIYGKMQVSGRKAFRQKVQQELPALLHGTREVSPE